MRALLLAALLLSTDARAEGPWGLRSTVLWDRETPRSYVSLRMGTTATPAPSVQGVRRPEICLEVSPLAFLSGEACGNGSGVLHNDPAPEIAHFRGKLSLASIAYRGGWIQPQLGAGFAELQVGQDEQGFDFGGTGPGRASTTGPEVGGAVKAVVELGAGFELILELRAFLAYFAHARKLLVPQQPWQPTLGFSVGTGF